MYALENYNLNNGEIRKIISTEGNSLKRLVGVSTKSKSMDLFLSFDMMPTNERIKWLKLKHYQRIKKNELTNCFLKNLEELDIDNSFISEIKELTKEVPDIKELNLESKCEIALKELEDSHEEKVELSKKCQLLKIVYNMNNKEEMIQIISKLIEFSVKSYEI